MSYFILMLFARGHSAVLLFFFPTLLMTRTHCVEFFWGFSAWSQSCLCSEDDDYFFVCLSSAFSPTFAFLIQCPPPPPSRSLLYRSLRGLFIFRSLDNILLIFHFTFFGPWGKVVFLLPGWDIFRFQYLLPGICWWFEEGSFSWRMMKLFLCSYICYIRFLLSSASSVLGIFLHLFAGYWPKKFTISMFLCISGPTITDF